MPTNRITNKTLPVLDISHGMLSSPQIRKCIQEEWLVIGFENENERRLSYDEIEKQLMSATYDMRMGNLAVRYEENRKNEFEIDDCGTKKSWISLPPNSLTFITTHEAFKLPRDVIARFNLKSKWVHKGLLLGTGPIVDPEFYGRVTIPIHNFSNQEVTIEHKESIIAVEFTRTVDLDSSLSEYKENQNWKGDTKGYLRKAGLVESSVLETVQDLKKANSKQKTIINVGFIAIIFALGSFIYQALSLIADTNGRMDNAINNSKELILSNEIKTEYIKMLESRISSLENRIGNNSEQINRMSNKISEQEALLKVQPKRK